MEGGEPNPEGENVGTPNDEDNVNQENIEPNIEQKKQTQYKTAAMKQLATWDEHTLGTDLLCDRYGYQSEYFLRVGVTNSYVKYWQNMHGKNEITTYWKNLGKMIFGSCYTDQCGMIKE